MSEKRTFQTLSGEVLKIRPVDEVSLAGVAKDMERGKPLPPIQIVQTSSGPKEVANENQQDYKDALASFQFDKAMYMVAFYIQFGVKLHLNEEQLEEVEDIKANRELLKAGSPENRFPVYLYVTTICPTMEELYQLVEAIKNLNTPSAEQVQTHLDLFRPGVPGQATNENQDASERNILPFGIQPANAV